MLKTPLPTILGGYSLVITNTAKNVAVNLMGFDLNSNTLDPRWLQVFSGSAVPANGTVPLYSFRIPGNQQFSKRFGDQLVNGVLIASPGVVFVVSSTEDTLTTDAAAVWDITALVEDWENPIPAGRSVAGDLTTAVRALQVWAQAAGPKTLYLLELINNAAVNRWAVIYAVDAPAATDNIIAYRLVPAGTTVVMDFGTLNGLSPIETDPTKATSGQYKGCTVYVQPVTSVINPPTNDPPVPGNLVGTPDFNIRAYYA